MEIPASLKIFNIIYECRLWLLVPLAITWFVYAAYFHVRPRLSEKGDRMFLAVGAVMIVLTLTWINLSRLFTGMHSYA